MVEFFVLAHLDTNLYKLIEQDEFELIEFFISHDQILVHNTTLHNKRIK